MSVLDQIKTARDDVFAARVMMTAFLVAQDVSVESTGTTNHAERIAYAKKISNGSDNPKMIGAHLIAANTTIQASIDAQPAQLGANISDADLKTALAAIWTARSLAFV